MCKSMRLWLPCVEGCGGPLSCPRLVSGVGERNMNQLWVVQEGPGWGVSAYLWQVIRLMRMVSKLPSLIILINYLIYLRSGNAVPKIDQLQN